MRTLIDLAAATDRLTLRAVFDQALREKKTTLEKLGKAIARSTHRPGVIDARQILREIAGSGGPTESELERYFLVLHWTWTALHERPAELIAELSVALNSRS